jgi:hypothetical protein
MECGMIRDLVKSFDGDLSRGAVDADKYYSDAKDVVSKTPLKQLVGEFNEVLKQYPEFRELPNAEPDAVRLILFAGALFTASCVSKEPGRDAFVLLGYSYSSLAAGRTLDAAVFLLASIALIRGRNDVAAGLLRIIGFDLEGIINFACGAVGLAKLLKNRGISSIPDW